MTKNAPLPFAQTAEGADPFKHAVADALARVDGVTVNYYTGGIDDRDNGMRATRWTAAFFLTPDDAGWRALDLLARAAETAPGERAKVELLTRTLPPPPDDVDWPTLFWLLAGNRITPETFASHLDALRADEPAHLVFDAVGKAGVWPNRAPKQLERAAEVRRACERLQQQLMGVLVGGAVPAEHWRAAEQELAAIDRALTTAHNAAERLQAEVVRVAAGAPGEPRTKAPRTTKWQRFVRDSRHTL